MEAAQRGRHVYQLELLGFETENLLKIYRRWKYSFKFPENLSTWLELGKPEIFYCKACDNYSLTHRDFQTFPCGVCQLKPSTEPFKPTNLSSDFETKSNDDPQPPNVDLDFHSSDSEDQDPNDASATKDSKNSQEEPSTQQFLETLTAEGNLSMPKLRDLTSPSTSYIAHDTIKLLEWADLSPYGKNYYHFIHLLEHSFLLKILSEGQLGDTSRLDFLKGLMGINDLTIIEKNLLNLIREDITALTSSFKDFTIGIRVLNCLITELS